ncbi:hypothetical protein [Aurantimonas coralicida]|uniref:hypothetical protein n=1 Tax=Aurantimonas coralicida TaxID=182270 RepID=UPI00238F3A2C|nr:hypothetical protein [Aurantimonas coralicida]MDE0880336.1 hypothetical protein [Sphingomonas bacterium]MDE0921510.1 hypothetical protein [Aurantimonas coralicida]
MALNVKAMSRYATSDRGSRNQANHYAYSTPDAAATLNAAGYFNDAATRFNLKKGDRIFCSVAVDGTPAMLDLIVTNVASGVVTVDDGIA